MIYDHLMRGSFRNMCICMGLLDSLTMVLSLRLRVVLTSTLDELGAL